MSLWTRITNAFRADRLASEIDEELASHIADAIEQGRDPAEARRAFGPVLHHREQVRDIRLIAWLDSLRADAVFGWRQLKRNRVASAAAILSLALAIGATTAAFRLVDAVLWRKLPVAEPERLYFLVTTVVDREGRPDYHDDFSYPNFRRHKRLIEDRADVLIVGDIYRQEFTLESASEP